ncbi:MAG: barstar family protein [Planctomycetota bacterium]
MAPFRMKDNARVWVLAVEQLEELGFVVTVLRGRNGRNWWTATSAEFEMVADGPLKLLGLLSMYQQRGEQWLERLRPGADTVMRTKRQLAAGSRAATRAREVPQPQFDTFAELDLSQVFDAEQLHDLLQDTFGLPPYYGRNWDAFDECISAPSESSLPNVLRVIGHAMLGDRLPRDARLLRECFDELEQGLRRCRIEWL